ncbi:MAG: trypsin-like peptidase domain-containing protein [Armatimonadetes bacterium]|nr:trypsin-like peptidase domain-containing protein [Armatimonadota bacterium]
MIGRLLLLISLFLGLSSLSHAAGLEMFDNLQRRIVEISNLIKPSVVHIEVLARRGDVRRKGLGSGLILTEDGTIVTNHHVIDKAEFITVILDDKTKFQAEVVREDPQTDLAVIQIKPDRKLPAARLADSDQVTVGEWVLAIGNPYGFDRTVSFGIVSGKGRYIPGIDTEVPLLNDFIQTDALIDPGSSGGPLINLRGEVIGINSVGIGRGQGFTIPGNVVKEVITRAQVEGRIERGWIGVYLQPFSRELATFMGAPGERGILVSDVQEKSPAAEAGLKSGDVILSFNGVPVDAEQEEEINRFAQMVTALEPGRRVPAALLRDGQKITRSVTIGIQPPVNAREIETHFGILAKEITQSMMLEYRLDDRAGALVSYISRGSASDDAGLEVGDVIHKIDGEEIRNVSDLEKALRTIKNKKKFLVTLKRGRITRFALIDLERFAPVNGTPEEET